MYFHPHRDLDFVENSHRPDPEVSLHYGVVAPGLSDDLQGLADVA